MRRSRATSTPERRDPPAAPFYTFLCGKGGVGKTTCAAALGVALARRGLRTLVVSIDPAPSLGDALGQRLHARATRVRNVARLHALELDAPAALDRWLQTRRMLLETIVLRGTWLDRDDASRLLRLSLPGVDEIAALLELLDLASTGLYDRVVVDTAPTGHFLRLLGIPDLLQRLSRVFDDMQAKHRILADALRGGWTPDAADALIAELGEGAASMGALLRTSDRSALWWVSLPEAMSVEETADAAAWLRANGFAIARLIANRITPAPAQPCAWCRARRCAEAAALAALRAAVPLSIPIVPVAAAAGEPRGVERLAPVGRALVAGRKMVPRWPVHQPERVTASPGEGSGVARADLARPGIRLVMFGGKGGVGKTTCAAAFAVGAAREHRAGRILLLSTDPAHSVADALGVRCTDDARPVATLRRLHVREVDAAAVYGRFRERFAAAIEALFRRIATPQSAAEGLVERDRKVMGGLLELAPPGLDELVAIVEVTAALQASGRTDGWGLIVMDTAPSGHALRLLEMPALVHEWARELMAILLKYEPLTGVGELGRVLLDLSQGIGHLREMLADPHRTAFVVVTRPAALPRAEALRLLKRLRAAGIDAPAVLVNAAGAGTCRRCRRERRTQIEETGALRRAVSRLPGGRRILVTAPAELPPPHGVTQLARWRHMWRHVGRPAPRL